MRCNLEAVSSCCAANAAGWEIGCSTSFGFANIRCSRKAVSSCFDCVSRELRDDVSTGSGANLLRGLFTVSGSETSLELLVLASIGCGAKRLAGFGGLSVSFIFLELLDEVSTGSTANRRGFFTSVPRCSSDVVCPD
jgi:hypothetical protein